MPVSTPKVNGANNHKNFFLLLFVEALTVYESCLHHVLLPVELDAYLW